MQAIPIPRIQAQRFCFRLWLPTTNIFNLETSLISRPTLSCSRPRSEAVGVAQNCDSAVEKPAYSPACCHGSDSFFRDQMPS